MPEMTKNQQTIARFMNKRESAKLDPQTPAQIGEMLAPEGTKNRAGWGRDNIRKMVAAGWAVKFDDGTTTLSQMGRDQIALQGMSGQIEEVTKNTGKLAGAMSKLADAGNKVADAFRRAGAKMAGQVSEIQAPKNLKQERALQLQMYRRMPKVLRQTPAQGSTDRKILISFVSAFDKREHRYHATKGWRSYRNAAT